MPSTTLISKVASLPHREHREAKAVHVSDGSQLSQGQMCSKELVNVTGKHRRKHKLNYVMARY